jgi:hypothetical protein
MIKIKNPNFLKNMRMLWKILIKILKKQQKILLN